MAAYRATKKPISLRRFGDRGVILITTLFLLTLLAGFAIAAQNRALSQARVLDRIMQIEEDRIALQSARALALPLVGEALLDGEADRAIALAFDGQGFEVRLDPALRADWFRLSVVKDGVFGLEPR